MPQYTIRRWLVMAATVATIAVNALANIIPFNGVTTGQVSAQFDNLFVPAPYVFSIWGVIYLGMVLYSVYQLLPSQVGNTRLHAIAPAYIIISAANAVWLALWHYRLLPATIVAMLIILAGLVYVYLKLGIGKTQVSNAQRWLVHIPFSIYLGWISVATIANAAAWLSQSTWSGWGISGPAWALIMMFAALVLGALMALTRYDTAYDLVLVWALVGIGVAQLDTLLVAIAAFVMAAVLLVVWVVAMAVRPSKDRLS